METEFVKGHYHRVAETLDTRAVLKEWGAEELYPLAVGAHVFIGELRTAEVLATSAPTQPEIQVACRFFLGVGYVRTSQYALARECFGQNLRLRVEKGRRHRGGRKSVDTISFFAAQGVAFYRFFRGKYHSALRSAELAYGSALRNEDIYGQILARDLLGHVLVAIGSVRVGLRHLEGALDLATKVGNGGVATALRISLLKFRSQYGLEPHDSVGALDVAIAELEPEDTYSRAELRLELARQLILRGQADKAQEVLNASCDDVYRHQNRRQGMTLNLRFAFILHLEGRHHQALQLLRTAERGVVADVDHVFSAQLKGLQCRIWRDLERWDEVEALESELRRMAPFIESAISRRMRERDAGRPSQAVRGEDPLGDLLDLVKARDKVALPLILDSGYHGLLRDFFSLSNVGKTIVFDLIPGSMTMFDGGNVRFHRSGINGLLRRLARILHAEGPLNKERLIQRIWRYEYDPLRHDPLVYSAMTKLRKLLEPHGGWVEFTEDGYRFRSDVTVIFETIRGDEGVANANTSANVNTKAMEREAMGDSAATAVRSAPRNVPRSAPRVLRTKNLDVERFPHLSVRQIEILEWLQDKKSVSVAECARIFMTSKITACRDLSLLHRLGHCKRVGKARATRYVLGARGSGERRRRR